MKPRPMPSVMLPVSLFIAWFIFHTSNFKGELVEQWSEPLHEIAFGWLLFGHVVWLFVLLPVTQKWEPGAHDISAFGSV